ncbi:MAG: hypothetical protein M3Q31_04495 [Actinomycetota bacterium]|nr:hypothetical protein [Actinomycetota bacterium]
MYSITKGLLRGSKPVVLAVAVVAAMSVGGTAYATKFITGADIKDGSITASDLSKGTKSAQHRR